MTAPAWNARSRTIIAARNTAMENIPRQNERLRIAGPPWADARPTRSASGAIADAPAQATAIVAFEEAKTRPRSHRIDAGKKSVTAEPFLPLHRTRRRTSKGN